MGIESLYKDLSCQVELLGKTIADSYESGRLDSADLLHLQEHILTLAQDISKSLSSSLSVSSNENVDHESPLEECCLAQSVSEDMYPQEHMVEAPNTIEEEQEVTSFLSHDNDYSDTSVSKGYKMINHSSMDAEECIGGCQDFSESQSCVEDPIGQSNHSTFLLRKLLPIVDYYAILKMCFHNRADLVSEFEEHVMNCDSYLDARKYIAESFDLEEDEDAMKIFVKALQKYYN